MGGGFRCFAPLTNLGHMSKVRRMTSVAFDDDDQPDERDAGMTGTYGPLGATDPLLDAYDTEVAARKANRPDGEVWWCDHCKAWVHTPLPHRYEGDTA